MTLPPSGSRPIGQAAQPVSKGYSDILHPRGFHGRWIRVGDKMHTTDLQPGASVRVPGTRTFPNGPHLGHVQHLDFAGPKPVAHVSLELPREHKAVQAALADFPDVSAEHHEFVEVYPLSRVSHIGTPESGYREVKVQHRTRPATFEERHGLSGLKRPDAARANTARPALPELRHGLRSGSMRRLEISPEVQRRLKQGG